MGFVLLALLAIIFVAIMWKVTTGVLKTIFFVALFILTFPWGPIIYLLWKIFKK
ncbi:MAG: hypothetical protein FWC27_06870 [Firmicutes bacterium]|nr:hypothetical protein [Bacillota bacterium]